MSTPIETVKSWTREQLESAFTQREVQLQEMTKALEEEKGLLKYAISDACDDDTRIRDLCRPFLTEATCDHDGYAVVPLIDVVNNIINSLRSNVKENAELKAQLSQVQSDYKILREATVGAGWLSPDEAKRLEAESAVMRNVLGEELTLINTSGRHHVEERRVFAIESAISGTAGKDFLAKMERYEKALKRIGLDCATSADLIAREALAHHKRCAFNFGRDRTQGGWMKSSPQPKNAP